MPDAELRLRLNGCEAIAAIYGSNLPATLKLAGVNTSGEDCLSPEFTLSLRKPSRIDLAGPVIVKLRTEGVPWAQIPAKVGLSLSNSYLAWKRYLAAHRQYVRIRLNEEDIANPMKARPTAGPVLCKKSGDEHVRPFG